MLSYGAPANRWGIRTMVAWVASTYTGCRPRAVLALRALRQRLPGHIILS